MGLAERDPLADEPLGDVGGQREALRGQLRHALRLELEGGDHPGDGGQQQLEGVRGVEDGLLVLLQVAVVGQRHALERGQQPREVADEAAGLAAGQLGDVRVLLLRHDRGPRGVRVVQRHEARLLGGPEDDLLRDAGQVDADHRGDPRELRVHVAGGGAVDRVPHGRLEAELGGHGVRVQTQGGAGQGPGAVRRDGRARVPVHEPLQVPRERPGVREQVVREQDGLRVLQVGAARHRRVRVRPRLIEQRVHRGDHAPRDDAGVVAQEHPAEGGDLVVAGSAGPQAAAELGTGPLDEAALERAVHVLIGRCRGVGTGTHVRLEPVEGRDHPVQVVRTEQTGGVQHPGVGTGAGDVIGRQAPVEVRGLAERGERLGRAAGEAAAPQGALVGPVAGVGVLGHRRSPRGR
ncbi:Uncharacterised protein [Streptococcus pneumoniae]|nr:Uncharacterised protein [Streptococcus pneumoniae]